MNSKTQASFDARGFYYRNGSSYELITGTTEVTASFYTTEISANLPFILSVIPEPSSSCALLAGLFTLVSLRRRRAA